MFGYIQINAEKLNKEERQLYRSYYCGLCHTLKKQYGRRGQLLLNYDMTFLALVLSGLYEPLEDSQERRCLVHPSRPHKETVSEVTAYAADMTILLSYQKALDDWQDDRSAAKRVLAAALSRDYDKLRGRYPRQALTLERCVRELAKAERSQSSQIDQVSGYTGRFLGEMFAWKDDLWRGDLYQMGFYLGKFIYLMDALDDLKRDMKKGSYNLLGEYFEKAEEGFEAQMRSVLTDLMACSCRAFERLPVIERAGLIRNVLYSGVWMRWEKIMAERGKHRKDIP